MKLRKKSKINKNKILIATIILAIITSYIMIIMIGKKIKPGLTRYITAEVKKLATIIINDAINEVTKEQMHTSEMFKINKNKNEEIESVDFDTNNVNEVLEQITENIQKKIIALEEGNVKELNINKNLKGYNFENIKKGIVCEITSGSLFGNTLLANTGPLIPIKMSFLGSVQTSVSTKIREYGINNVYLEVNLHVEVTERVTMPIFTEEITIEDDIPIAIKVIQGKLPNYYNNGIEKNSNAYTLPK